MMTIRSDDGPLTDHELLRIAYSDFGDLAHAIGDVLDDIHFGRIATLDEAYRRLKELAPDIDWGEPLSN